MKNLNILLMSVVILFLTSCDKENNTEPTINSKLPETFMVDIPSSLSQSNTKKRATTDYFSGNDVYQHLNNFIYLGESTAEFIQNVMRGIRIYGLNEPMEFSFTSEEDGRLKNVLVTDNTTYEGQTWQHLLLISDAENESNDDSGKALQVFWNTNPIKGIALLKPKNWDFNGAAHLGNVVYTVAYDESNDTGYDATMLISIYGWEEDYAEQFHMDNLKMFAGKSGDEIIVYGNSNHPDAWLLLENPKGFDWTFVAAANQTENIAIAEVGLPSSNLDESSREVLLKTYSVKNVLTSQIREYYYQTSGVYPDSAIITAYLADTEAPAFFNAALTQNLCKLKMPRVRTLGIFV